LTLLKQTTQKRLTDYLLSSQYGDSCHRIPPQFIFHVLNLHPVSKEWNSGIEMSSMTHPEPGDPPIISSHLNHIKLCAYDLPMKAFWFSHSGRG